MARTLLAHARANVVGYVALFVALGGTSYAVARNSIDSRAIKNNSVASVDIRNNAVASADVKNASLVETDLKKDTLTGTSIREAGLGTVPSATRADTADAAVTATNAVNATNATNAASANTAANALKLEGNTASAFLAAGEVVKFGPIQLAQGAANTNLITVRGFRLVGRCGDDGGPDFARTFVVKPAGSSTAAYESHRGDTTLNDPGFPTGDFFSATNMVNGEEIASYAYTPDNQEEFATYVLGAQSSTGAHIIVNGYQAVGVNSAGGNRRCVFGGVAFAD